MPNIFISYSRRGEDGQYAKRLAETLEAEGYSVWWDEKIRGGDAWAEAIERKLAQADAVVVVWSNSSVQSPWVLEEASYAREQGKLVSVVAGSLTSTLPFGFQNIDATKITKWPEDKNDPKIRSLKDKIRGFVNRSKKPPKLPFLP